MIRRATSRRDRCAFRRRSSRAPTSTHALTIGGSRLRHRQTRRAPVPRPGSPTQQQPHRQIRRATNVRRRTLPTAAPVDTRRNSDGYFAGRPTRASFLWGHPPELGVHAIRSTRRTPYWLWLPADTLQITVNNLIKRVKRSAFGFRRFKHYRIRATPADPTGHSSTNSPHPEIRRASLGVWLVDAGSDTGAGVDSAVAVPVAGAFQGEDVGVVNNAVDRSTAPTSRTRAQQAPLHRHRPNSSTTIDTETGNSETRQRGSFNRLRDLPPRSYQTPELHRCHPNPSLSILGLIDWVS